MQKSQQSPYKYSSKYATVSSIQERDSEFSFKNSDRDPLSPSQRDQFDKVNELQPQYYTPQRMMSNNSNSSLMQTPLSDSKGVPESEDEQEYYYLLQAIKKYMPLFCEVNDEHSEDLLNMLSLKNQGIFEELQPLCTECLDSSHLETTMYIKSIKNVFKDLAKQIYAEFLERKKIQESNMYFKKLDEIGQSFISLGQKLMKIGHSLLQKDTTYDDLFSDLDKIKAKMYQIIQEKEVQRLKNLLKQLSSFSAVNLPKGRLDLQINIDKQELQGTLNQNQETMNDFWRLQDELNEIVKKSYKLSIKNEENYTNVEKLKLKARIFDDQIKANLMKNSMTEGLSFFPYKIDENNPEQLRAALRQSMNQQYGYNFVDLHNIEREGEIILPDGQRGQIHSDPVNNKIYMNLHSDKYPKVQELDQSSIFKATAQLRDKNSTEFQYADHYFLPHYYNTLYANFEYKDQEDNKEKVFRNVQLKELKEGRYVKETHSFQLEIAFVIDTTSSMDPYIVESKNTIIKIIEDIEKKYSFSTIKFTYAIVAYRDHNKISYNNMDMYYITKVQDFTDREGALNFLKKLDAFGGDDVPEAVLEGLCDANLKLSWNDYSNIPTQKFMVHIADAPPHGNRYNDYGKHDNFPEGSMKGVEIEDISRLINKRNITYVLIQIGCDLTKMIQVFKQFIDKMGVSTIDNASKMTDEIIRMIEKELEL